MAYDDTPTQPFTIIGTRPQRPDGIDKVTGRARFGADMSAPGMLTGRVLRAPHPHARITRLDTAKAAALPGVKAIVTAADFIDPSEAPDSFIRRTLTHMMARDKVLYDGHGVAAVAAVDAASAEAALAAIEVEYDPLPHVIDVDAAMAPDAPILHDDLFTKGVEPKPTTPSNVAQRYEFGHGDVEAGFAKADLIVERSFKTAATHQGYIEPHACLASMGPDGAAELWCCTQGHYMVRAACAAMLRLDAARIRVTASEIGGGFGGKTTVHIEPIALALSKKSGRPVKMTMSREEVFRASGPTASTSIDVKVGVANDGTLTAAFADMRYQGGCMPGSPASLGAMAIFAPYELDAVKTVAWDVVTNRPKQAAYRAPGSPMAAFAAESVMDEIAGKLGMDPIDFRLKNAAKEGTLSPFGVKYGAIGCRETLEAVKNHPHYAAPLGPNQGRGISCGFWFNFGGETCVSLNITADGAVNLSLGTPDIGGSRASMAMMAAEELGIAYDKVRPIIADTSALGFNDVTDGSRVTFAAGLATIEAARAAKQKLCARAAQMWDIPEGAVEWRDGAAHPAGPNAGSFPPLSLAEIAAQAGQTGGPIAGHHEVNAEGAGVSFGTHLCDIEVDPETGRSTVLRYLVAQDAGKAVHPDYVEGQMQGGAVQGIGWALNEAYIYGDDGRLQNPGFLDYRIPVASDLPMIDTAIVEVPNPGHPYGVRGVGETSIAPPLAAVSNAVSAASGHRMTELPMSPPVVLKAIKRGS